MKRIESDAAAVVFERPIEIKAGCWKFTLPRPTFATLVAISEVIAELPSTKGSLEHAVSESLAIAPKCKPIGRMAAMLLFGVPDRRWFRALRDMIWRRKVKRYGEYLMRILTPEEMKNLVLGTLEEAGTGFFFGLTTSLIEVNILRRTKTEEVEQ
ncbi:MAG: hypothetical protein IKX67_07145 [Bacteroidales bacterium]|nr:hypothetical protein [Bacteroidales bacterium]